MSSLLLDSHALLWWEADDPRLSAPAREGIARADVLHFSAASIWELAIKQMRQKLRMPAAMLAMLADEGFVELPISARHGLLAAALPAHHSDPFDRLIVAQAQSEGLTVVSRDERMALYGVPVLW